jgi:DNA polymerase
MTEPPWSDKSKPENQREKVKTVKAYAADGKKWLEFSFYGGLFAQNITQAVARDLLADSMLRVEAAGYPIVLSVHDELVAEVPENFGSLEEFLALAAKTEAWAGDLPVVAKGFRNRRYRKG